MGALVVFNPNIDSCLLLLVAVVTVALSSGFPRLAKAPTGLYIYH